ncbi:SDR family NAD(P)-dependent oxidoreductase [Thalassotalea marina]|uniref:3-oxoacyl-ACP reductase n=1 Tax=Thalassotalea marina TaxID=1673741 RepID=A0A919EHF3_9GAMM|nr:SDR family NAD(P)-dependent oxidoreductase [Thalassotalea marina]GHF80385.1 3-oxoacyl-ACP reductase [Thalassotalea marina]
MDNVLVTGAYGGIGTAVCRAYAKLGAHLIIVGRDLDKLNTLKKSLESEFSASTTMQCIDLNQPEQINAMCNTLRKQVGSIDVMVHCAGMMHEAPLMMTRPEEITDLVSTNIISSIQVTQAISKLMIRQKKGAITLMSSIVAKQGAAGQSVYCASKAAIDGLVVSLAQELGALNIRVNAIAPGFIETPLVAHYDDEQRKSLTSKVALKRLGTPNDIAKVACFLSSPAASYITGQIISVDGGLRL